MEGILYHATFWRSFLKVFCVSFDVHVCLRLIDCFYDFVLVVLYNCITVIFCLSVQLDCSLLLYTTGIVV